MSQQTEINHRFLCCNQETYEPIIWQQYGYWCYDARHKSFCSPPDWATRPEVFEIVKHLVDNLKEANLQIEISNVHMDNTGWCSSWILFDPNNPHIEGDKGAVCGCRSEQGARDYAMKRYHELKELYDGDIEALLVYKKTGAACLPNWNHNEIDSWGYKEDKNGKVIKTRVPRAREVNQTK